MNQIRNDLRVPLLTSHLTEASHRLMAGMPDADVASYDCLKTALLREHRFIPNIYRHNFKSASRETTKKHLQYSTHLASLLKKLFG